MRKRLIPESFHPGDYILEEAKFRNWSYPELAEKLGWGLDILLIVLGGNIAISTKMAKDLGRVFETGSAVWMKLQGIYDLTKMIEKKRGKHD
jgi:plasmid maintenance system antidote protein VapI